MLITSWVKPGENRIVVRILADQGPFSRPNFPLEHAYGSLWGPDNIKGGLWQSVTLKIVPEIHTEYLQITPKLAEGTIEVFYEINNTLVSEKRMSLIGVIQSAMKQSTLAPVGEYAKKLVWKPGLNTGSFTVPLRNVQYWTPDTPNLY